MIERQIQRQMVRYGVERCGLPGVYFCRWASIKTGFGPISGDVKFLLWQGFPKSSLLFLFIASNPMGFVPSCGENPTRKGLFA